MNMNMHLYEELEHLSIAERRSLGEALIDSAESEASASLITEAQRAELRSRLAYHRANLDEPGVTFAQLKDKLLTTPRLACSESSTSRWLRLKFPKLLVWAAANRHGQCLS